MLDPDAILELVGPSAVQLAAVLAIVVVGWIAAVIVRGMVRRLGGAARLDARAQEIGGQAVGLEQGLASAAYALVLLLTAIAVAGRLDMPQLTEPLQALTNPVFAHIPRLVAGGALALVAWLLATVVRQIATTAADATSLDERLSDAARMPPLGTTIASIAYWAVWLLMLPGILDALGMQGLLSPVVGLVGELFGALPNLVAALLIGGIGWVVAKALRAIVTNMAQATGLDALGERSGALGEGTALSDMLGIVVQIVVFVPALAASADALEMPAVSTPIRGMLDQVSAAVPNLIAAALVLAVVHFVVRLVAPMLESLLHGLGADDRVPERLGLAEHLGETQPSRLVGQLFYFFAMLFAAVEASHLLGFAAVADLAETFIRFGGQVLLGGVILIIGFALANAAYRAIETAGGANASFLASIARVAIMGLVLAMGLDTMGIAETVVQAALMLTLGAVAVALALAFGLGGREAAGELARHWAKRFTEE